MASFFEMFLHSLRRLHAWDSTAKTFSDRESNLFSSPVKSLIIQTKILINFTTE
jgi:hypothetical protein